ncbi:hypothetical protein PC9H_002701 [Pleurotus ostreatus]|uniref:Uncharacterized protein n=1 Tax=Pleurotus ostreatus TaxID=5322 RepID=A0A8H6ZHA8_PLEOS|nr:uncharacterized protein PC9H_002701 [Pleurotus ostreatus]KAF7416435.1 hypothetical protein PC9H_002701 [Pleurotus ostreatus]
MSHYVSLHSTLPRLLDWLPSPPVELSNVTVNAPLPNIISPPPTSTWGGMGTIPTSDSVFGKGERNRDSTAFVGLQYSMSQLHDSQAPRIYRRSYGGRPDSSGVTFKMRRSARLRHSQGLCAAPSNSRVHVSLRLDDLMMEKDTTNAPSSCQILRRSRQRGLKMAGHPIRNDGIRAQC